jgi:hypothetical protein
VDSARAIAMRCRWPPENWCGYFTPSAAESPTRVSSSATRDAVAAGVVPGAWARIGSAMTSATRQRGLRLA